VILFFLEINFYGHKSNQIIIIINSKKAEPLLTFTAKSGSIILNKINYLSKI